jgi:hypothetical protein
MSTLRTVLLTCAAVLAVAWVPFFWQRKADSEMRNELATLEGRRLTLEQDVRVLAAARLEAAKASATANAVPVRTVGDILAAAEKPLDAGTLISSLMEMMMSRDMVGMLRVFLPIANLSKEAYDKLMDEIQAYEGNAQMKEMAMQMLAGFAPSGNPRESLERMMALDLQPYSYAGKLGEWAKEDPDAALRWFEAKRAAGKLDGKGVHNTPEQALLGQLIGGMSQKDPARAFALYESTTDKEARRQLAWQLGASFGANLKETGDDTYFRKLIESVEDSRSQIVSSAVNSRMEDGKLDDGLAFIDKYLDKPEERSNALRDMLANQRNMPIEERGDWLVAHVDGEALPQAMEGFVQRLAWERNNDLDKWLAAQPAGEPRDRGFVALAETQSNQRSYAQALGSVGQIRDATRRANATEHLARNWLSTDPEKARVALPPDVIERLDANAPK